MKRVYREFLKLSAKNFLCFSAEEERKKKREKRERKEKRKREKRKKKKKKKLCVLGFGVVS
ncbi:hypothetical protein ACMBCN_03130 [Candidatus Liberibacter asiaticus]|nr:hypothetical protein [Candidatus Liberibacter asiaticus]